MTTAQVINQPNDTFNSALTSGTGSDLRGISSVMLHGKRYNFHKIESQTYQGAETRYGCTVSLTDFFVTIKADGSRMFLRRGLRGCFTKVNKPQAGHKAIINHFNL